MSILAIKKINSQASKMARKGKPIMHTYFDSVIMYILREQEIEFIGQNNTN